MVLCRREPKGKVLPVVLRRREHKGKVLSEVSSLQSQAGHHQKADSSLQHQPMLDVVWGFSAGENIETRFW